MTLCVWFACLAASAVAASVPACSLKTEKGPVVINESNVLVEYLDVSLSANNSVALSIENAQNVTVKNVRIEHPPSSKGLFFSNCSNIFISNVEVIATGSVSGPNPCALANNDCDNIHGVGSTGVVIDHVRLSGGSTGIELASCSSAQLSFVHGMNFRGPFPRGQCVQFTHSDNSVLQDFYCFNDNTSYTEDNINVWRSSHVTVQRGVVDGNNSPTGVGVIFEGSDNVTTGGLISQVDALHQGDGCFSGYPAQHLVMDKVRCRDNHCTGWAGRGKPASNSLMWCAGDEQGVASHGIMVTNATYYNGCNHNVYWEASPGGFFGDKIDVVEAEFEPRDKIQLTFCWDT